MGVCRSESKLLLLITLLWVRKSALQQMEKQMQVVLCLEWTLQHVLIIIQMFHGLYSGCEITVFFECVIKLQVFSVTVYTENYVV